MNTRRQAVRAVSLDPRAARPLTAALCRARRRTTFVCPSSIRSGGSWYVHVGERADTRLPPSLRLAALPWRTTGVGCEQKCRTVSASSAATKTHKKASRCKEIYRTGGCFPARQAPVPKTYRNTPVLSPVHQACGASLLPRNATRRVDARTPAAVVTPQFAPYVGRGTSAGGESAWLPAWPDPGSAVWHSDRYNPPCRRVLAGVTGGGLSAFPHGAGDCGRSGRMVVK